MRRKDIRPKQKAPTNKSAETFNCELTTDWEIEIAPMIEQAIESVLATTTST